MGTALANQVAAASFEELQDEPEMAEDAALIPRSKRTMRDICVIWGVSGKEDLSIGQAVHDVLDRSLPNARMRGKDIYFTLA